jgi:hypothetical protein
MRIIAQLLIVVLWSPVTYARPQNQMVQQDEQSSKDKLPDSPGTSQAQSGQNSNQQPSGQQQVPSASAPISTQSFFTQDSSIQSSSQQSGSSQSGSQTFSSATTPQQPESHQPLGTAAAESIPTMGIAASQPAGAAVAPAKQRRVRTILIRVGAVVAGAAAVGAVVALSEGSPSRPPGAH